MENKLNKYSVSQLNRLSRQTLESKFPLIWVEGEISGLIKPASGHWYFKMKDKLATVDCAMFRAQNSRCSFELKNGSNVLARCKATIYEANGKFQLIIEYLEDAGAGALQRKFEELKQQLLDEGLFDDRHKLTIPRYPKRIGLITSPTGAAVQDILSILRRRYPIADIEIYPSIVQGKTSEGVSAAQELSDRIICANKKNRCDVLILSRGGGSIEDLWAFNDEALAHSIYDSLIPIISAIGHEIDFTIADFVADYRAPTPSAAAEIVSPDINTIILGLEKKQHQLERIIHRFLQASDQRIDSLYGRIRNPVDYLLHIKSQLKGLRSRAYQSILTKLHKDYTSLAGIDRSLTRYHPHQQLINLSDQIKSLEKKLKIGIFNSLTSKHKQWENSLRLLNAISPLNTLERGYAIILDSHQKLIKNISDLKSGDKISTRLSGGVIFSSIDEIVLGDDDAK